MKNAKVLNGRLAVRNRVARMRTVEKVRKESSVSVSEASQAIHLYHVKILTNARVMCVVMEQYA